MNYTTVGEKELLGIVEGLKAFNGILHEMDVTVHTDHLNLLYIKTCYRKDSIQGSNMSYSWQRQ